MISLIVVLFYLIFLFHFISFIGVNLALINDINEKKEKRKEGDQKVRCERDLKFHAGHLPSQEKKNP